MVSKEIGNKDTGQVFYWIYRSKMVMESMEIGDKRRRTSVLLYLRSELVMVSKEIGNKDTGQVFYWIYRSKMVMESMEIGDKRRRTSVLLYLKKRIGHGE